MLVNILITRYEGQITALLGHNGAGKSTLLSVLTGFYDATDGDAEIYGKSLRYQLKEIRKDLGVCLQENLLIPVLTVGDVSRERGLIGSVESILLSLAVYGTFQRKS